uniref:Fur-regulated basic protein FbpA n=1 Tax=Dulem virus 30 TaxID=3145748 RepID=A0AAU8B361_9CAUD
MSKKQYLLVKKLLQMVIRRSKLYIKRGQADVLDEFMYETHTHLLKTLIEDNKNIKRRNKND